ncbi:MAG: beta-L-arabinofuranosidase domain-containing protein, partial [Planctomycetota bacterium]
GEGTEVRIVESTDYPFRGTVDLELTTPKPVKFPLILRLPGWCNNAQVRINDQKKRKITQPRSWIILDRLWNNGDKVNLHLLQKIKVNLWKKNKNALSVSRGPLAYSLKIQPKWSKYGDDPKWPAYEVFPDSPWNYGLIANRKKPEKSFQVIKSDKPLPAQPFTVDGSSVQLQAKGKRIPQWQLEDNGLIGPLPQSPLHSDQPVEDITLIPMGCARLRLSVFPQIEVR